MDDIKHIKENAFIIDEKMERLLELYGAYTGFTPKKKIIPFNELAKKHHKKKQGR